MRQPANQAKPAPPRAATPVMARPRLPACLIAVSLVLLTIALYWPATRCGFVNLDDPPHLTANVQVQKGLTWEGIKWVFLNPVPDNWHPLTALSHMAVCQMCGLNPWGHHLTNVVLHALNAGLVFALLRQMTGATWRSLLVAAFFAVHPLRVEAVAWVTERKGLLSGLFGLLALIAYARYTEVQSLKSKVQSPKSVVRGPWSPFHLPSSIFYLLSLFLYALGLMSKPMLVTWPCVMLLLDYWPLRRLSFSPTLQGSSTPSLRLFLEKIPFFVLAALASLVTFVVQRRAGSLELGEMLPLGARVGNALISYCRYLGKLFWPTNLVIFYPHPGQWPLGKVLLAVGLLLGLSVLVWVPRRRYPYLLMGWLWYCGTLAPVSQVVQTGGHAMADRYTYLPSLGVLVLAVWGVWELTRGWRYQVRALSVAGGAALVLCLALTRQQIGYWKDTETLLRHAQEVPETKYLGHKYLGIALLRKGQIDEAIRQFREGVRLRPDDADAHYSLGVALDKKGQIGEAIRQFQEAVRLEPDHADAHNNLGVAYGVGDGRRDQLGEMADAHYNLGVAFFQRGRTDEAIRQFQEALRLKPDRAEAHNNLGTALGLTGRTDEAIRQFQEALRLKPDYAEARKNLGVVLATKAHSPPPGAATNR